MLRLMLNNSDHDYYYYYYYVVLGNGVLHKVRGSNSDHKKTTMRNDNIDEIVKTKSLKCHFNFQTCHIFVVVNLKNKITLINIDVWSKMNE